MSERLDDRIRALYSELTDTAPDVPPLPASTRAPVRSPRVLRPRVLVGAAAVLIAVVGLGALISNVDFGSDDEAVTTRVRVTAAATTAAPTTASPTTAAATAAPTTAAPATTAPTTTGATTAAPTTTRPVLPPAKR